MLRASGTLLGTISLALAFALVSNGNALTATVKGTQQNPPKTVTMQLNTVRFGGTLRQAMRSINLFKCPPGWTGRNPSDFT